MALPTKGRVIIDTTVGEIDIELWSKETPKACRNFIALAMEGYYDGVIFHRVIPGFLVQTGDRTGTGGGGESFFGEPFEDEIHPRLRFPHRGLVALANRGTKNSNDSQFFITLDRADELHGKNTLFGRCVGDTFYNVLKIGELELDNERPLYPPKIKSIRIVDNPFDDIVPRITADEKRAQQRARVQAQKEREDVERKRGAKKNVKLLSFGADEDEGEEPSVKKKSIIRPDLVLEERSSAAVPDFVSKPNTATEPKKDSKAEKLTSRDKDKDDITKIREKHAQEQASEEKTRKNEIAKMEAEIRKLAKRRDGDSDEDVKKKKPKKSYLEAELAKYVKGRGKHKKGKDGKRRVDESDVLTALNSFRGKLQSQQWSDGEDDDVTMSDQTQTKGMEDGTKGGANVAAGGEEDPGLEVDADFGFMNHVLHFPKDDGEETQKAERDYEVIDPRQRGAQAREEDKERRRALKASRHRR